MKKTAVPQKGGVAEAEGARATIVGGRPPGKSAIPRQIPRGLEVLVKKAAVDPKFKQILFEKRAEAAKAIRLNLNAAEEAMLAAVPLPQLEGIIAHTRVSPKLRPAFLGYAASVMLAALGVVSLDHALERYEPKRENNQIETVLHRLKTYTARYKGNGKSPEPRPAKDDGIVSDRLFGEKDLDAELSRIATSGVRPDPPFPNVPGGGLTRYIKGESGIYLVDPKPLKISGIGASAPDRSRPAIGSVFWKHLPGVLDSYETALADDRSLEVGRILVRITIYANGTVGNASAVSDTINNAPFRSSLLSLIRSWRFPPVEEGTVTVVYPFVFVAKHDDDEE